MIVRMWKGRAAAETADEYLSHLTTRVFPRLQQIEGYIGGRVLRRTIAAQVEFLVATEWASWDAIRAFAGDTPDRAVVEPEARRVLSDFDERVEHFEVVLDTLDRK